MGSNPTSCMYFCNIMRKHQSLNLWFLFIYLLTTMHFVRHFVIYICDMHEMNHVMMPEVVYIGLKYHMMYSYLL